MPDRTVYEIVIRGRASARLLRPLLDDFTFDHGVAGETRLVGWVTDACHLQGLLAHLASVPVEIISLAPLSHEVEAGRQDEPTLPTHQPRSTRP